MCVSFSARFRIHLHSHAYMQGLNTTGTLVSICQNDKFEFSFLQNTYLGLSQAITSTISTLGFWYIQRYWKISTKKMVHIMSSEYGGISNSLIEVYRHKRRHNYYPAMGYDWIVDWQARLPQCLGILVGFRGLNL